MDSFVDSFSLLYFDQKNKSYNFAASCFLDKEAVYHLLPLGVEVAERLKGMLV